MSQENETRGTRREATHCCVCRRKLTDPVSIEWGIGPVCRQRLGVGSVVAEQHEDDLLKTLLTECSISAKAKNFYRIFLFTSEIRAIGFDQTAHEIEREFGAKAARLIVVRRVDNKICVRVPHIGARERFRTIGGTWDPVGYNWVVDAKHASTVNEIINTCFSDYLATSAKGAWIVGSGVAPQRVSEDRDGQYVVDVTSNWTKTKFSLERATVRSY